MIEFDVVLHCPPDEAWHRFTGRISEWWPISHRLSKDPHSVITLQPDGGFSELATDGRTFALGRVRRWDPPVRLELDFYLGTGPEQPTDVIVTFEAITGGTRVTVRHRPLPESSELWSSRVGRYQASWPSVLSSLELAED